MRIRPELVCFSVSLFFCVITAAQGKRFSEVEHYTFLAILCTGFICAAIRQGKQ